MKPQTIKRLQKQYGITVKEFTPFHFRFTKPGFDAVDFYPTKNKYTVVGTGDFLKTSQIETVIKKHFGNAMPELGITHTKVYQWCKSNGADFLKQSNTTCMISRGKNSIRINHILRRYEHLKTRQAGTFRGQQNIHTFLNSLV